MTNPRSELTPEERERRDQNSLHELARAAHRFVEETRRTAKAAGWEEAAVPSEAVTPPLRAWAMSPNTTLDASRVVTAGEVIAALGEAVTPLDPERTLRRLDKEAAAADHGSIEDGPAFARGLRYAVEQLRLVSLPTDPATPSQPW